MSGETVEPLREKIRRMLFPSLPRKKTEPAQDYETVDPLERFENAIRKDAENAGKNREETRKKRT